MNAHSVEDALGYSRAETTRWRIVQWEPRSGNAWSDTIHSVEGAGVEHLPQWFTAIKDAYGHSPMYCLAEDQDGAAGVLPAFLVRSRLFGTVLASMPFLDAGGPCARSPAVARALVEHLILLAAQLGAERVELRCSKAIDVPIPAMQDKVNLVLPLPDHPDRLWRQFDAKVRNQVRKAESSGLSAATGGVEMLDDFYGTWSINMRDLGSPVHDRRFFRAIFAAFGGAARIILVHHGATPVAGLVALTFKDRLVVPWASARRDYFASCPNMLLYWHALRTACLEGFRQFEFGRSSRGSGTYRFKRQWRAVEQPLFWYTVPLRRGVHRRLSKADPRGALLAAIWRRLPFAATRWLGPRIRRSLTQ
jgi:FemAB-related protein (PEP-CTERM system-associated)